MRTIGLSILLLGIIILIAGLIMSQAVTEKVVEGISGHPSYLTEYLVGSLVFLIAGAVLIFLSRETKS